MPHGEVLRRTPRIAPHRLERESAQELIAGLFCAPDYRSELHIRLDGVPKATIQSDFCCDVQYGQATTLHSEHDILIRYLGPAELDECANASP
jgi:hypothetical protein